MTPKRKLSAEDLARVVEAVRAALDLGETDAAKLLAALAPPQPPEPKVNVPGAVLESRDAQVGKYPNYSISQEGSPYMRKGPEPTETARQREASEVTDPVAAVEREVKVGIRAVNAKRGGEILRIRPGGVAAVGGIFMNIEGACLGKYQPLLLVDVDVNAGVARLDAGLAFKWLVGDLIREAAVYGELEHKVAVPFTAKFPTDVCSVVVHPLDAARVLKRFFRSLNSLNFS